MTKMNPQACVESLTPAVTSPAPSPPATRAAFATFLVDAPERMIAANGGGTQGTRVARRVVMRTTTTSLGLLVLFAAGCGSHPHFSDDEGGPRDTGSSHADELSQPWARSAHINVTVKDLDADDGA